MKFQRLIYCFFLLAVCSKGTVADDTPVIAVAANFVPALEEIIKHYTALTGQEIKISAGATGTLVNQIMQGAPFQLFLSADEKAVIHLHDKGYAADTGRIYAIGVLVLYLPHTTRLDIMVDNEGVLEQLFSNKKPRVAIANPDLAPYGLAAKQVLERFGKLSELQDRLILGENVGQTAQFAQTGSVDAAFLPYSIAITPVMQTAGQFQIMSADWYAPVKQRMVLLKNAGAVAREFYQYLSGETAQQIIRNYGYSLPAE